MTPMGITLEWIGMWIPMANDASSLQRLILCMMGILGGDLSTNFHSGFAVFFDLFRFSGHCHFLVKQTLGIHFRRNPLSRNSWRKRDPVSKEKDACPSAMSASSLVHPRSASSAFFTASSTMRLGSSVIFGENTLQKN